LKCANNPRQSTKVVIGRKYGIGGYISTYPIAVAPINLCSFPYKDEGKID